MATAPTSISDALFTSTQQRVLGLLFGQPERVFSVSELIALAHAGSGAVQRELERLAASGLVTVRAEGGRKLVQANREAPVFEELRSIIDKTLGAAAKLRAALLPHGDRIRVALLFGSTAKGGATASSDVDVLIVSDELTLEEIFAVLEPVERQLGRRVDPAVYTSDEVQRRWRDGSPFVTKVLGGEHTVLLGSEDDVIAAR